MSKTDRIIYHIKTKGSITSMEAFSLYNATRLSSIIANLRKKYLIDTTMVEQENDDGRKTRYAIYTLRGDN